MDKSGQQPVREPGYWLRHSLQLLGWNPPARIGFTWPSRLSAGLMLLGSTVPVGLSYYYLGLGTPIWVSVGIILAVFLRNPPTTWPCLSLILLVGEYVAGLVGGETQMQSIVGTICDLTDLIPAAFALHFLERAAPIFSNIRQITGFALINLIAPVPGALVGGGLLVLAGSPFLPDSGSGICPSCFPS